MISTATAATDSSHKSRFDSEPAPSGDFPHSVNWGNPRVAAILDAAAQCFSQRGFTATTLADIGKELGLRKSIVHYYFTSKATLVQEVQSFAYGRYLAVLRSALLGGRHESIDPRLALVATILALGAEQPSVIDDVECLRQGYPRWLGTLRALGVQLEVREK